MKLEGMFVVSLRGVNFGFWSHLGYSGQNAIIFSPEAREDKGDREGIPHTHPIRVGNSVICSDIWHKYHE